MEIFQPSIHQVKWRIEWGYSGQCVKLITDLKTRVDIKNERIYTPSSRVCLHDVHTGTFILAWRRSKIYNTLFCIFSNFSVIYFHLLAFQNTFLKYQYFIPFSCSFLYKEVIVAKEITLIYFFLISHFAQYLLFHLVLEREYISYLVLHHERYSSLTGYKPCYRINIGLQGHAIFSPCYRHQLGEASATRELLFRPRRTAYREVAVL